MPFDKGAKIVTIKYFHFESEAQLYAARLREAGIKSFISNAHAATMIPMSIESIGLHVRIEEAPQALEIIKSLDQLNLIEPEESFHDADKDDIYYEMRKRSALKKTVNYPLLWGILFLIFALILVSMAFFQDNQLRFW